MTDSHQTTGLCLRLRPGTRHPSALTPTERASSLLALCLAVVLGLLMAPLAARAQDAISTPLSGSIGDPIYSESNLTGPSGSLVEGDTNLLTPYIRTGISDPLDFLIESGFMSPYDTSGYVLGAYDSDAYVLTQVINDSTVAARFNEYRDNRLLMGGAGGSSLRTGRAQAAGGSIASSHGTNMAGATSFSGLTSRAPFAAGSSILAAQQAALSGISTFADPNQLVAAATSSGALNQLQGDVSGGAGAYGSANGESAVPGQFGTDAGASYANYASIPVGMLVPAPNSTATGPGPGDIFPDVSMATVAGTGFQDSTMGTAGLPMQTEEPSISPLAAPVFSSGATPFGEMSAESTQFLSPTLMVGAADQGQQQPAVSLGELTRQARLHAMIYDPTSPMPSPFQQRAMQKEYLRKKNQHHVSRYPALTAPSITP